MLPGRKPEERSSDGLWTRVAPPYQASPSEPLTSQQEHICRVQCGRQLRTWLPVTRRIPADHGTDRLQIVSPGRNRGSYRRPALHSDSNGGRPAQRGGHDHGGAAVARVGKRERRPGHRPAPHRRITRCAWQSVSAHVTQLGCGPYAESWGWTGPSSRTRHIVGYSMGGVRANRSEITLDGAPNTALNHRWGAGDLMAGYTPPRMWSTSSR